MHRIFPAEIELCHTTEDSISIEMMEEGTVGYLALATHWPIQSILKIVKS